MLRHYVRTAHRNAKRVSQQSYKILQINYYVFCALCSMFIYNFTHVKMGTKTAQTDATMCGHVQRTDKFNGDNLMKLLVGGACAHQMGNKYFEAFDLQVVHVFNSIETQPVMMGGFVLNFPLHQFLCFGYDIPFSFFLFLSLLICTHNF